MDTCPLKPGSVERLFKGAADREERLSIMAHLQHPCSECAETILGLPADLERAIVLGLLEPTNGPDPLSEDEKTDMFRSIMTADSCVPAGAPVLVAEQGKTWKGTRLLGLAALVVLMFLVPVAAHKVAESGLWTGIKQGAAAARGGVFLEFLVLTESDQPGRAPTVERGDNNGRYPRAASLLFRYQVDSPVWLYLARCGATDCEVIFPEGEDGLVEPAGFYDASAGGELLVYPLARFSGAQTFCAVAYPPSAQGPGVGAAKERVLKEVSRHREASSDNRLRHEWMDCFQIEVGEK
ncbi:MAG TPA: hypothetical protein VM658_10250 [bacterium]|nr:hypothetical protein [bacterium]